MLNTSKEAQNHVVGQELSDQELMQISGGTRLYGPYGGYDDGGYDNGYGGMGRGSGYGGYDFGGNGNGDFLGIGIGPLN